MNEFGEIDIDNQIVETDWEDDDTIMLNNGCICCSINDSFLSAVHRVLEKADAVRKRDKIDRIQRLLGFHDQV